ncbi:MAG TPA: universal stress protein [Thermoanaerobaculia bacterium]|nr:universal stress protein [Thermoanaerobaculia bacterium]
MIDRILVPTDLSDFAREACAWASFFHRRLGSRITLLFANEPYIPIDIVELTAAYTFEANRDLEEKLAERLDAFADEVFPGMRQAVETMVVDAAPAPAIVDTAKKIGADLILMGTHGRRGWRRALLGSVTEGVLRETDRPLMSVPSTGVQPALERIVCPVNFTDIGRKGLESAIALAEAFGAKVHAVHVADPDDAEGDFGGRLEALVRDRCDCTWSVARGNAAEEVLRTAAEGKADLIVIGAQHKRFTDTTVLGTTTERVVRFARRPVWTVFGK